MKKIILAFFFITSVLCSQNIDFNNIKIDDVKNIINNVLNKNIFTSINKDKFSIFEVWDKEINNKQLYGIESVNEFLHVTDLDIYKKLSS